MSFGIPVELSLKIKAALMQGFEEATVWLLDS
jgi:hypothetical protein